MLEWLGKLLPKEIKLSINFSPRLTINHIKINSDNSSSESVMVRKDQLIINDATEQGKKIADKVIKQLPNNLSHNDIVLEDTNLENFRNIDKKLSSKGFKSQFNEFKRIVPKKDIPILEIAIIVREKYETGENVSLIKGQAVQRFGPRAGMICNLYTSGYFHTLIKPLYDSVIEGKLALDEYLEIYEMIVTESPLAMFIGIGASFDKAKRQLLTKIQSNKDAEVDYLNIHGIGSSNFRLIETLLNDLDTKGLFVEDPTVQKTGKSIKATIYI